MVKILLPPPRFAEPQFLTLDKNTKLFRIFCPEYNPTALTFRSWGPFSRFDHHRGNPPTLNYNLQKCEPCHDIERGICYAALKLSSCLVEVFGDECFGDSYKSHAEVTDHKLAILTLKSHLKLLDVRGSGAMLAGANEATLAKIHKRRVTQAWSRYFYEQQTTYPEIQGIIYGNAHNNEDAIAFYERAQDLLNCDEEESVWMLREPKLRGYILKAAKQNNLRLAFPEWLELRHSQDSERMIGSYTNSKR
ncbi:MAG: RES family NAD+ phosphorylase [Iphinoe sp. HA4291-MV1]|nr:RES family NAD+ phosphorylase [Iphinoe sp. HA4291-MV1]